MAEFQVGEMVDFTRNSEVNETNVPVAAVIPLIPNEVIGTELEQTYIIPYPDGWFPNLQLQAQYNLNPLTKYLYVYESELAAV